MSVHAPRTGNSTEDNQDIETRVSHNSSCAFLNKHLPIGNHSQEKLIAFSCSSQSWRQLVIYRTMKYLLTDT